eukprot:8746894-Pyramimonas_sp.AAC.1
MCQVAAITAIEWSAGSVTFTEAAAPVDLDGEAILTVDAAAASLLAPHVDPSSLERVVHSISLDLPMGAGSTSEAELWSSLCAVAANGQPSCTGRWSDLNGGCQCWVRVAPYRPAHPIQLLQI